MHIEASTHGGSMFRSRLFQTINWKYATGEFILIVAGVIVALAAAAWWEGRNEQRREQQYLRQLLNDARENERRLGIAIQEDSGRYFVVGRLVAALAREGAVAPRDSVRFWWSQGPLGFSEPRLVLGTVRALVASGDFRLLRRPEIRLAILAYLDDMEGDLRALARIEEQHEQTTTRILERVEPVRVHDSTANFELDFAALVPQLREDPLARSTMRAVWRDHGARLYYLQRMVERTRTLRDLLSLELMP